jgi:myo-inositol-1(or 4)-monophosphatase
MRGSGNRELLDGAVAAARAGGGVLRARYGSLRPGEVDEKGTNDFVTAVDRESEEAVLAVLRDRFPGTAILAEESSGEEGGGTATGEGLRWVVDPLDGTTNYIHGYPCFAVSVSCERDGRPAAGAVLDPHRDALYTAARGAGAWRDGEPIEVAPGRLLHGSLLVTGFPFRALDRLPEYLPCFEELLRSVSGMRRDGSAALDMCYVACGWYDGFWEMGLSRWDLSAGSLIVEEAGGIASGFCGKSGEHLATGDVVAANAHLHPRILEVVQRHFRPAAGGS